MAVTPPGSSRPAPASSPRDEQTERTRGRILQALVELVAAEGVHDLSVQQVADRAGVAHRTVYRHFPDKAALLDGLSDWMPGDAAARFPNMVANAEIGEIADAIGAAWDLFDETRESVEAYVRIAVATGAPISARQRRMERIRRSVAPLTGHLNDADAEAVLAVFRALGSPFTWSRVRHDHNLKPGQARDAFAWVARLVRDELLAGGGPHASERSAATHDDTQHAAERTPGKTADAPTKKPSTKASRRSADAATKQASARTPKKSGRKPAKRSKKHKP